MLDNLTQRLSRVMKTLRGEARLTESNIADALREVPPRAARSRRRPCPQSST
jgi:signal recognition particle GTPase